MPRQATSNKFSWSDISQEQLHNLVKLIGNDGHSIYPVSYLRDAGVDERIIKQFVITHKSSRTDFKEMIEVNGVHVDSMDGVYGLTVLWSLADHFNESSSAMGRGFQAQELTKGIRKHINVKS